MEEAKGGDGPAGGRLDAPACVVVVVVEVVVITLDERRLISCLRLAFRVKKKTMNI